MGQRLNIEIKDNGKSLANSYYHWSAYTDEAAHMLGKILKSDVLKSTCSPLEKAVKLLIETGAGFMDSEMDTVKATLPEELWVEAVSRNEGLLAITEDGMQSTRDWEEGRVEIDLGTKRVLFDVFWEVSKEELKDEYPESKWERIELPFNTSDMTFEEAKDFIDIIDFAGVDYKLFKEVPTGAWLAPIF